MIKRQMAAAGRTRAARLRGGPRSSGRIGFGKALAAASLFLLAAAPAAILAASEASDASAGSAAAHANGASPPMGASAVEQGRYLAAAGNCVSCHTREDGQPFSGGVAFATPFGTLYSTNITPDAATGIGDWSEEQFARAMREGVRPSGEHLYPAFPYTSFTKLSDADVAALFAYLKSVPAVQVTAPQNELSFPFNQRWALGLWKTLYFDAGRFVPEKTQSAQWNRGAYLVQGLGHCSACHSPRNFLGAEKQELALTGGTYQDKIAGQLLDWSATNLTSAPSGLKSWSVEEVASYLKLGFSVRAGVFGPMSDVIVNSTRHLSDADVGAMAVYLKSLPANEQDGGSPPDEAQLQAGSLQYDIHCGTCHLPTGLGSPDTGPPLLGSPVSLAADPASLINIVLNGAQLPVTPPSEQWKGRGWKMMEPFSQKLSDEDAAALLSYVRNAWGNKGSAVSAEQVAAHR